MNKKHLYLLLAIFALGAFFRFSQITEFPLGLYPDEAMNGNNALEAMDLGAPNVFYPENNGREGLFINMQIISVALFGNKPWALRIVSAFTGTLAVLGVYLVAKELLKNQNAALLASFFTATSYWHINFSRTGFRAILVPTLSSFALYFLLKGMRNKRISDLVFAGIFTGLGFYTYIAFRFIPFVFAVPIIWALFTWYRNRKIAVEVKSFVRPCTPCAVTLFLFATFVVALPIGVYFLRHPQDFIGRGAQISIFSAASPMKEFIKSSYLTLGMFFWKGDCNWRHNFNCQPELYLPVAIFFVIGMIFAWRYVLKRSLQEPHLRFAFATILAWGLFMSLPARLTLEGIPHALRSIGMIPPVMIVAGFGAWKIVKIILTWFERQELKFPDKKAQLRRIVRELKLLFAMLLLFIPLSAYDAYFFRWAQNANTYEAFSTDQVHLGKFLNELPPEITKYVVVNMQGVLVRGIPMPAQTVMFMTNTFREERRAEKHIVYLLPEDVTRIKIKPGEKTLVTFLYGFDKPLIARVKSLIPNAKMQAPDDFVVLKNY